MVYEGNLEFWMCPDPWEMFAVVLTPQEAADFNTQHYNHSYGSSMQRNREERLCLMYVLRETFSCGFGNKGFISVLLSPVDILGALQGSKALVITLLNLEFDDIYLVCYVAFL